MNLSKLLRSLEETDEFRALLERLAAVHAAGISLGPAGSWERSATDARLYAAAIILCGLAAFGRAAVDRSVRTTHESGRTSVFLVDWRPP